jgi:ech hydrogenase subunit A
LKGADAVEKVLLAIAILLPALSAILCYIIRKPAVRTVIVVLTTLIMFGVAGGFTNLLLENGGKLTIEFSEGVELSIGWIIKFLDLALLLYILYIGAKLKSSTASSIALLSLSPLQNLPGRKRTRSLPGNRRSGQPGRLFRRCVCF